LVGGRAAGRALLAIAGLLGLQLLLSGCSQRAATATGLPVLFVPADPPKDEPPPAGLALPLGEPPGPGKEPATSSSPAKVAPLLATAPATEDGGKPTPTTDKQESASELACDKSPPDGMVCIPGGPFWRGTDNGKPDERPRMRVVISPFFMDTYEVTNEQYFKCVEAGRCDPPIKYYPMFARPQQPVVAVSWYESYDFCQWAGKRLPTEAEWEKAARGPDGEVYPWGNEPATCDRAVYESPLGAKGCGTGLTSNVGSRPVGRYGLFDMAGNSWEWVSDWKTDCYLGCAKSCGDDCNGPDPRGPCGGGPGRCAGFHEKILKGGSWYFTADRMRGAERRGVPPTNRGPHRLGFRCARSVNPSPSKP
jgi:formylglycine-generating enzyme required for sulfatase activity